MPTSRIRFTVARIEALTPLKRETFLRDTESPLGLRLLPSGAKSYVIRFRLPGGRGSAERRYTIGGVAAISLDEARRTARAIVADVDRGHDPKAANRKAARTGTSLLEVVEAYLASQRRSGIVSVDQIASSLKRDLLSSLSGQRDITDLSRAELMTLVAAVAETRPGAAEGFRRRLHGLFAFAVDAGLVPANVLAGGRRRRRTRAERLSASERQRGRQLAMTEIAGLWAATHDRRIAPAFGAYVRFLLVAGTRRGETAKADLSWLTQSAKGLPILTIPGRATKNGHALVVPLPPLAMQIIEAVPRHHATTLIFPGAKLNAPISGWSKLWPKLMRVAADHGLEGKLGIHDLRKTVRSHWSRLGVPSELAERMLNYRPRDALEAVYDLEPHFEARSEAMLRWCREIEATIVTIRIDVA